MQLRYFFFISIITFLFACNYDKVYIDAPLDLQLEAAISKVAENGDPSFFILPESNDYSHIPQDVHNPLTYDKVKLGNLLFFETGLANIPAYPEAKGTYSCSSCHVPDAGFRPGAAQGIADGGVGFGRKGETRAKLDLYEGWELDAQGLRPLSILNVAYVENTTWNGRFGSKGVNEGTEDRWELDSTLAINEEGFAALESQSIEGLELHRMEVTEEMLDIYGYRTYFNIAFPTWSKEERYSKKAAAFAISAYLRTVLSNKAPFQEYLKGKRDALTNQEKRGAILFFGDARCFKCHKNTNLGANEFYAVGVKDLHETNETFNTSAEDTRNLGRGDFTGEPEDMFKFKVPQLYNLGDSPFYFHGSSKKDLKSVIEYFNDGIPENDAVPIEQISRKFHPLKLSTQEVEDLVAFFENGLRDPDLERYAPSFLPSGNCFPNNDSASRRELGCE